MRQGKLEIVLIDSKDKSVLSERVVQGRNFCVAEANQDYLVQVQLHDTDGQFRDQYLQICLKIDGKRISYSYVVRPSFIINGHFSCTFKGFKALNTICAFRFDKTLEAIKNNLSDVDGSIGKIEVELYRSESKGVPNRNCNTKYDTPLKPVTLADGVKFWKQPGLSTATGAQGTLFTIASVYYHTVGEPILTASLSYQTKTNLDLLESAGQPVALLPGRRQKSRRINDLTEEEPAEKKPRSLEDGEVVTTEDEASVIDLVSEEDEGVDELYRDL